MRPSDHEKDLQSKAIETPLASVEQQAYDGKVFFESFYRANVRGEPEDRMTIGAVTEWESRYHYNCVENSIIQAAARRSPPPAGVMVEAQRMLAERRGARLLDIGSGTGHWIDFFRVVFVVSEAVGLELAEAMSSFLKQKYAAEGGVVILEADLADEAFSVESLGPPFDYISAVGVMFHIVDDARWARALANLSKALKPEGLLFVTGAFGPETRNAQFHKVDRFDSWREFDRAQAAEGTVRVNKRIRSLSRWVEEASRCGLAVVDLIRSPRDPYLTVPENDLLVLVPRGASK